MYQHLSCVLFLALIFTARAQYSACTIGGQTPCTGVSPCTCVSDPNSPNCTCAERLCGCTANCPSCAVVRDATTGKYTCDVPCGCQTASCNGVQMPTCSTGSLSCVANTVTKVCEWSSCPTQTTCPTAGKDVCDTATNTKPTCAAGSGPALCQTNADGRCEWGSCPTTPPCEADPSTGKCGGQGRPTTCLDGVLSCGLNPNGVCGWLCQACYDQGKDYCLGKPKPAANTACAGGSFTCARSPCGWTSICPSTCTSSSCTDLPCPAGTTLVPDTASCRPDQTGKCVWFGAKCVTTDPLPTTCLDPTGLVCGGVRQPTSCIDPSKSMPAAYKATCNTLTLATPNGVATTSCQWTDNCEASICAPANGLCGGEPEPSSCRSGFSSTAAAPTWRCTGTSATSCQWTSEACLPGGCSFNWLSSVGLPTCGSSKWPCPSVAADLPASLFSSPVAGSVSSTSLIQTSASRIASLCTQKADLSCGFPDVQCQTQKCFAQLSSDGSITCGGNKRDATKAACSAIQIFGGAVCAESTATASGCDWKYTCIDNGVHCLKEPNSGTCGGIVVPDTCAAGASVLVDFSCYDDPARKGSCLYEAKCQPKEVCDTNLDRCVTTSLVGANAIATTCADTETLVAPAQCCCVTGGRCYLKGLQCKPKNPCSTCPVAEAAFACPAGQKLVTPPTCITNANGGCELTPAKCIPVDPVCSNTACPVLRPCPFGQIQKSVKCDATLCQGIPECGPDNCAGNDPCKCDNTQGCVWVVGPSAEKSYCVHKSSYSTAAGAMRTGSEYCKPTTTNPPDHVTGIVNSNTFSQTNLDRAIKDFIADLQQLERKLCENGSFCLSNFLVSFFAVVAPKRNSADNSLTVSATLLFTTRDGSANTPQQIHFDMLCPPVKKLLSTLTGAFKVTDNVGSCSYAISKKRDVLSGGSTVTSASLTVPADVYQKYISASTSVVSGCLVVISALIALFLF